MFFSRRMAAVASTLVGLFAVARVTVLFLESLSAVREERESDLELLRMCQDGAAQNSLKMRRACLQAQADRASPIILKALLHSFRTAFDDFSHAVSSPSKLAIVCLFAVSSVFLPISSILKLVAPASEGGDLDACRHVVVFRNSEDAVQESGVRRLIGNVRNRVRKRKALKEHPLPSLIEIGAGDSAEFTEVDIGHFKPD